jgi:hypothetical protein
MLDEQSILISYGESSAEVHQIVHSQFSYKANLSTCGIRSSLSLPLSPSLSCS